MELEVFASKMEVEISLFSVCTDGIGREDADDDKMDGPCKLFEDGLLLS